jgi:hypothetical protein
MAYFFQASSVIVEDDVMMAQPRVHMMQRSVHKVPYDVARDIFTDVRLIVVCDVVMGQCKLLVWIRYLVMQMTNCVMMGIPETMMRVLLPVKDLSVAMV